MILMEAPARDQIVLAAECRLTWSWPADLCAEQGLPVVLGHAHRTWAFSEAAVCCLVELAIPEPHV